MHCARAFPHTLDARTQTATHTHTHSHTNTHIHIHIHTGHIYTEYKLANFDFLFIKMYGNEASDLISI